MYFEESDLNFIFSFNGTRSKNFINEYSLIALIALRDNNINAIKKLLFIMKESLSKTIEETIKRKLEKAIQLVNKCLEANENFNCKEWANRTPASFSKMQAEDFKFKYLIESFTRLLGTIKLCIHNGYIKDSYLIKDLLTAYNECFKSIGIFGLKPTVAENIICGNSSIDPADCCFKVEISDNQTDDFHIYDIPFFIKYPHYRSIDNKLVEYTRLPIYYGKIVYSNSYYDELDDSYDKKEHKSR